MKIVSWLILLVGLVMLSLLEYNGQLRFLQPDSRLGFLETRIAGVEAEFMRRSPALKSNYAQFQLCIGQSGCNYSAVLDQRNKLLAASWPDTLERLMITDDWGQANETVILHQRFLEDIRRAGGKEKAKNCRPLIRYYQLTETSRTLSVYEGLRCPTPDPS